MMLANCKSAFSSQMAAMTVVQYVIALFVLWFITVFLQYIFKRPGKKPAGYCLPPSPPTLPLIGHLHLLTPVAYKGFHALNNKYGPLLYLRFATYPAVLVSSAPVATEIFRAQDVHFASRIKSPFEDNLLFGSSTSFFNAPYGDYWKFMKKIFFWLSSLPQTLSNPSLPNKTHTPEIRIVQKLLMSLNRRYQSIVSIIEETRDLDELKVEEVIASVKVFEQREDLLLALLSASNSLKSLSPKQNPYTCPQA